MWQEPKINWMEYETYDLEVDAARVENNIHELAGMISSPPALDEKLTWTKLDFFSASEVNRIVANINALITAIPSTVPLRPTEYGDRAIVTVDMVNMLETYVLWLYWSLQNRSMLMDNDSLAVTDNTGAVLLCDWDGTTHKQSVYKSSYTGQQIDAFVRQIREWNNGYL